MSRGNSQPLSRFRAGCNDKNLIKYTLFKNIELNHLKFNNVMFQKNDFFRIKDLISSSSAASFDVNLHYFLKRMPDRNQNISGA